MTCLTRLDFSRLWVVSEAAAKGATGQQPRVMACGECSPLLWAKGKLDAAIRLEQLWDEVGKTFGVISSAGIR